MKAANQDVLPLDSPPRVSTGAFAGVFVGRYRGYSSMRSISSYLICHIKRIFCITCYRRIHAGQG